MDTEKAFSELRERFPGLITQGEPLARHTFFNIGGPADFFCHVTTGELLVSVLSEVRAAGLPHVLIGGGSNLLIDDRGFRGLVIEFTSGDAPVLDFPDLRTPAGLSLASLLDFAAKHSAGGLEFLAGIPGTAGGAVYMNAGAYGSSIGDVLKSARIITAGGETREVSPEYFEFSYRASKLQRVPEFVIEAVLTVNRREKSSIIAEYDRIKALRAGKHPDRETPCAGSYFKNLPPEKPGENRRPAGLFLEKAGAKSMCAGGAAVFHKHANMIINTGGATARDVQALAEQMKKAVYDRFGIVLEEEVRFLDAYRGIFRPAG